MAAEPEPRRWTIVLEGRLPLPNETLHWTLRERMAAAKEWRERVTWAANRLGIPYLGRARVHCARLSAGTPDADALPAAFKPILDGLCPTYVVYPITNKRVRAADGVIEDDDPAHVRVTYESRPCRRGNGRIEVVIEPWAGTGEEQAGPGHDAAGHGA